MVSTYKKGIICQCGRQCSALLCRFLLPRSLLASTLFVGNVACAFIGLRVVDVPMFLCVRRVTTVCVLVTEYIMLRKVRNDGAAIGPPRPRGAVCVCLCVTTCSGTLFVD